MKCGLYHIDGLCTQNGLLAAFSMVCGLKITDLFGSISIFSLQHKFAQFIKNYLQISNYVDLHRSITFSLEILVGRNHLDRQRTISKDFIMIPR